MLLPCQSTFHIFTFFGLYWPTFLLYQPISFYGFPRPIYFLYTSFTPMGFLLNHLVFLDPITTSLSLITFQAYWPLSQPNEFTNSFPELSRPIYFLITSYCSHGFTTSFIGFPLPIYFLFTSYYSHGITTSSIGFPRPIFSFFTSFTLMGFLLDSLGFLGPITTNLPVITFQAYWPLSQPNEFTNSFSRLPGPIHFLFTSYYFHGFTT